MKITPKDRHRSINYSQPLFAAGLIASSLVYSIAPVLSAPISSIDNQATATYEDPSNPPTTTDINDPRRINTVSNLIKIIINEVAGINITQKGIANDKDVSISSIKSGDTAYFRFDITNTGNEGTKIFVPNQATLTGAATVQRLEYFDNPSNTWKEILDGGFISGNIPSNSILKVRVLVKVNDIASGKLSVSLGKTSTKLDDQNIEIANADLNALKLTDRVFTIDNDDSLDDEIAGAPNNGTREAMDTQTISIVQIEAILNGTRDNPAAQGIGSDNNQDYTNKSILTSVQRGQVLNPPPIGFTNTVENSTSESTDIKILPVLKADEMLPNGTTITLRDAQRPTADFDIVFTVTNGAIVPANSSKPTLILPQVPSILNLNRTASRLSSLSFALPSFLSERLRQQDAFAEVKARYLSGLDSNIDRLKPNSVKLIASTNLNKLSLGISQATTIAKTSYIMAIDLPSGTEVLKPYAVELIAFIDRNNDNLPNPTELQNKTIDRAYTGFIDVLKESRVLDFDNKTVLKDFSITPKQAKSGQYLEYRITFKNISSNTVDANGSKGISAANFTIIEDGYITPNNWGGLTENDPNSTTVSVGSVGFSRSDKTATTTLDLRVTKYIHSVGTLAPQAQGTFIFRRRVSQ